MRNTHVATFGPFEIAYEEAGRGFPVVLVHGNFASRRWFTEQLNNPPEGLRLIALDLPGFRGTPGLPDGPSIAGWGEALHEFTVQLGLERYGLVGHSLGGAVVQHVLIHHPERVANALLVDSSPPGGFPPADERLPIWQQLQTDTALLTASLMAIMPKTTVPYIAEIVADGQAMDERYYAGNAVALGQYDFTDTVKHVTVPVHVLYGALDSIITREMADQTAALFNTELTVWDDVGHSPPIEAPEHFTALLADLFLFPPS